MRRLVAARYTRSAITAPRIEPISPAGVTGRSGGLRSHKGPGGRTDEQLYEEAKDRGIRGRSRMNKAQLKRALDRRAS